MKLDSGLWRILKEAEGVLSLREPPVPREWDDIKRPHVALLQCFNDDVVRFYLSEPHTTEGKLDAGDLTTVAPDSVIEVRYDHTDYRYYKRRKNGWAKVAETRNLLAPELHAYVQGSVPVRLTLNERIMDDVRRTGYQGVSD